MGKTSKDMQTLDYEWTQVKQYKRFTLWKHKTRSGSVRYECFWHEQNPNRMKMMNNGIMGYEDVD